MAAPFGLAEGLQLGKSELILPWDWSMESLCKIGSPEIYRNPRATTVLWKDETVFGGIAVDVSARTEAGNNVFSLDGPGKAKSAQAEYENLLHELSLRFGEPSTSAIDEGYLWTKWIWGEVAVSLRVGERFTEYVSLVVAKGFFHEQPPQA